MLACLCYLHGHAGRFDMEMLAADIGGTRSRFFRFSCNGGEISIKEGLVLSSVCHSFDALLGKIFACWPEDAEQLKKVSLLIFAAAGPVKDGAVVMTNASFRVEKAPALARFPGAQCLVMNDFEAQAWACLSPVMREAETLLPGRGVPSERRSFDAAALSGLEGSSAPVAVIGAGTGLGASWLLPGREETRVLASEGGHMPFPFEGEEECAFASWLARKVGGGPVTAEHVLSGPGLARLYEYLCGRAEEPSVFTKEPGFAGSDCCALYARFYGRFCRMAALALLPQAVVLTGGVAEKSPALVRHEAFAREFLRERGGRKELLAGIPVWLNRHPQAGLWGAARAGAAFAGAMQALPEGAIRF